MTTPPCPRPSPEEKQQVVFGEPTAAVTETFYTIPVTIGDTMYEFQTRYRRSVFVPDGGICKDTDLRKGKMTRAQLTEIIPLIESEVKKYAER